jgi:hypothetical protein
MLRTIDVLYCYSPRRQNNSEQSYVIGCCMAAEAAEGGCAISTLPGCACARAYELLLYTCGWCPSCEPSAG